jgi:hypothetical protein
MTDQRSVYFIRAGNTNHIKIGSTSYPVGRRVATMQTGCPELLRPLLVIPNGSYGLEGCFHRRFAQYRVRGEWFQYEPRISAFIKKIMEDRFEKEAEMYWETQEQRYWDETQALWEKEIDAKENS